MFNRRAKPRGWLSRHHKQGRGWYRRLRLGFFRWRRLVYSNTHTRRVYKTVIGMIGTLVVVTGVVLLPLPGPGWLVIFIGLAIIASEFAWAARLLHFARVKVELWTKWVMWQPLWLRWLIGTACFLVVVAAVWVYFFVFGIPSWLPLHWLPAWTGLS